MTMLKKLSLLSITLLTTAAMLFGSMAMAQAPAKGSFEAGKGTFLLNGKPFVVKAVSPNHIGISASSSVRLWA